MEITEVGVAQQATKRKKALLVGYARTNVVKTMNEDGTFNSYPNEAKYYQIPSNFEPLRKKTNTIKAAVQFLFIINVAMSKVPGYATISHINEWKPVFTFF